MDSNNTHTTDTAVNATAPRTITIPTDLSLGEWFSLSWDLFVLSFLNSLARLMSRFTGRNSTIDPSSR